MNKQDFYKKSKYNAKRTTIDGYTFASQKEAKRYQQLKMLEKAKEIKELRLQVPFTLIDKSEHGRAIKYVADFTYWEGDNFIVEDTKGVMTPVFKIKSRLMKERHGINIRIT